MTVVDRWKWKSSHWRPFPHFEEPRKIAVMAVSPTPSRLVTLGSRLLKKVLFCESSGLRPRVDSFLFKSRLLNKKLSGTVLYWILSQATSWLFLTTSRLLKEFQFCQCSVIFLLSGYESALRLWYFCSQATSRLFLDQESTPEKNELLSQFCKINSSGLESSFILRVDSWRSTPEEWSSDTPPIRPETLSFLPRTCVDYV